MIRNEHVNLSLIITPKNLVFLTRSNLVLSILILTSELISLEENSI